MLVWTDTRLSPAIARWLREVFGVGAFPVREFGLRDAEDPVIFAAAREAGATLRQSPRIRELLAAGEPLVEISDAAL